LVPSLGPHPDPLPKGEGEVTYKFLALRVTKSARNARRILFPRDS